LLVFTPLAYQHCLATATGVKPLIIYTNMSDWIKIHRSVIDSYSFADPVTFKIWVWMLLKANYKPSHVPLNHGRGIVSIKVDRGQFIFGRNKAAEELEINGSTIYRHLQKLENQKQINIEANNQYSLITICNYNTYQNVKDKDEQVTNNYRTSNEQVTDSKRTSNEHIKEELEEKEDIGGRLQKLNGFVCYDVEKYILDNQQVFEKICMATSRKADEVKKELHLYHLWLAKKEMYPMGNGAAAAGIESWIHNSKTYKQKYGVTDIVGKVESLPDANVLSKKYG
jgi:DNA-binding transcriptional regulator YhcF (GntR family)